MSYSCTISFKKLSAKDLYPFLTQFKKTIIEHFEDIAEENIVYSPYVKTFFSLPERTRELDDKVESWAKNSIFKYRYYYDPKHGLLGVYGVPNSCQALFDGTCYFQNSCDQDYKRSDWNGVDLFEKIFDKWAAYSEAFIKKEYRKKHREKWNPKEHTVDIDYYRRSFAYEEIWSMWEHTLEDDDSVVYLSLFGYYDLVHITCFSALCYKKAKEWYEKFEEKFKKSEGSNNAV